MTLARKRSPGSAFAIGALVFLDACAAPVAFADEHADGTVRSKGEMLRGAQTGEWIYYWENGRERARGRYEQDLQVGPWSWWHENGNKSVTGSFRAEHSEGEWRYWHPNGKPHMTGFFDRGQKTGEWSVFDGEGRLVERGHYANGKRTGRWEFRHGTGSRKADGWFLDGEMIGVWTFSAEAGDKSTKTYPLPSDLALFGETWGDGKPRRIGFLHRGLRHGRWVTWHDNGERRISGDFDRGRPIGPWRAFAPDGKLLAWGRVDAEGAGCAWSFERGGGDEDGAVDAVARPPAVWSGVWSKASEFDVTARLASIERWFLEASSPTEKNDWESLRPDRGEPTAPVSITPTREIAAVRSVPREPVAPPILTRREIENMGEWLKAYTKKVVTDVFDIYGGSKRGARRRDKTRSNRLVDKKLASFEFAAPDGTRLALGASAKRWTLLVLLRGFAGQVCPYCPVQLKALAPYRTDLEQLGVRVVAVYPGPRAGLDGFCKAYEDTFGRGLKSPYTIFYDVESRLARELGVLETDPSSAILARPTTLLLDEQAAIRYSYVGRHRGDRPAAESLLAKIRGFRRE